MRARLHLTPARLVVLSCFSLAVVLWWWAWPVSRAHYLAGTGTWPEKNHFVREADCLYAVLRTRPITDTGPAIVRGLVERRPVGYYNGRKGEHSWRFSKISRHQRTYYLAEQLWRDAHEPPARQALVSALPALLRAAKNSSQRNLVIHSLKYAWNPEARTDLIRITSDLNEDIGTRAAAVAVLLHRDDPRRHVPAAIEIIQQGGATDWARRSLRRELSPIQRKLYLFHTIIAGARIELLSPDDRAQLVQVGMSLLRELPESDLAGGYSVARLLGRMVNPSDGFVPDQRDYKVKKGGGLEETFYTDTVKNALAWQSPAAGTPVSSPPH